MSLLVDLFGYLSIVLHGLVILAQSMAIGRVLFLVLLARPFAPRLAEGAEIARRTARLAAWSALALALCEGLSVAMQCAVLMDTLELPLTGVLGAEFRGRRAAEDGGGGRCSPPACSARAPCARHGCCCSAPSSWLPPWPRPMPRRGSPTAPCCWRPARCTCSAPRFGSAASRRS